jgi:hypothetical protein
MQIVGRPMSTAAVTEPSMIKIQGGANDHRAVRLSTAPKSHGKTSAQSPMIPSKTA